MNRPFPICNQMDRTPNCDLYIVPAYTDATKYRFFWSVPRTTPQNIYARAIRYTSKSRMISTANRPTSTCFPTM